MFRTEDVRVGVEGEGGFGRWSADLFSHICIHAYIDRERERESEKDTDIPIHALCMYIYIYCT